MENLKLLKLVVVLASFGLSVKTDLLSGNFVKTEKPSSYYAKEEGRISTTYCVLLCGREEGCVGVGIENVGQKVNCYFFNLNGQGTGDVVPPPGIEHWIDSKKFTLFW